MAKRRKKLNSHEVEILVPNFKLPLKKNIFKGDRSRETPRKGCYPVLQLLMLTGHTPVSIFRCFTKQLPEDYLVNCKTNNFGDLYSVLLLEGSLLKHIFVMFDYEGKPFISQNLTQDTLSYTASVCKLHHKMFLRSPLINVVDRMSLPPRLGIVRNRIEFENEEIPIPEQLIQFRSSRNDAN